MSDREPNSLRYWRLNSLMALRAAMPFMPPRDLEELERQEMARGEYRQLQAREAAVRARYARIKFGPG